MKGLLNGLRRGFLNILFLLTALVLVTGCGSGGPGEGGSPTGSVAVLLTDNPVEDFSAVNVTVNEITLISENHPPVVLFNGSRRIDLLSLQENNDLFTVHEGVPVRVYSKIRFRISDPEFVKKTGEIVSSDQIQLVANGKLDLVLKDGVPVVPGETLVLRLDLDAEKSIHIHVTGSGIYKFRPVVFVEVLKGFDSISRFVSIEGVIESIDPENQSFLLRRDDPFFDGADEKGDSKNDSFSHEDDEKGLIRVAVLEETRIFLPSGPPGEFESLEVGQNVFVRGFLTRDENLDLLVRAKLIQLGDVLRLRGIVTDGLTDQNQFGFSPDEGESVTVDLLVQLYGDTRLFEAGTYRELEGDDLVPGRRIILEGVLNTDEGLFHASLIIVKSVSSEPIALEGIVQDLVGEERTFHLSIEGTPDCDLPEECLSAGDVVPVYVLPDAVVIRINETDAVEKSKPLGVEIIPLEELMNGDHVHLFGKYAVEKPELFEAKIVIVVVEG